jgi:hypothetical protein
VDCALIANAVDTMHVRAIAGIETRCSHLSKDTLSGQTGEAAGTGENDAATRANETIIHSMIMTMLRAWGSDEIVADIWRS